jgi:hypothetical protein
MKSEPPIYLSLGAGVQSSMLALKAAAGEITPMPTAAIFADTMGEPASVYEWLDYLEAQLPFPVYRVSAGSLAERSLTMRTSKKTGGLFSSTDIPVFTKSDKGTISKIRQRSCTRDFKIVPILKKCRELIGTQDMKLWRREFNHERRELAQYKRALAAAMRAAKSAEISTLFGNEPVRFNAKIARAVTASIPFPYYAWDRMQASPAAIQWIGISADEVSRIKPSRDAYLRSAWPLAERGITRPLCVDWLLCRGHPEPPKSACVFCPFHDDLEWLHLLVEEPEEFAKAVAFEKALQANKAATDNFTSVPYLHRSCVPLDEIDFVALTSRPRVADAWQNECEGMCGV